MTQRSRPWDGTAVGHATEAPYSAAEWTDIWRSVHGADGDCGILPGVLNELEVTGVATPLSIDTGEAMVQGWWYQNDAAYSLVIVTPAAATRYDYVALELGYVAQTVTIVLVGGVEGAGVPPALTQTVGVTWQIPLAIAAITIGGAVTITDARREIYGAEKDRFFGSGDLVADDTSNPATLNAGLWEFTSGVDDEVATTFRMPEQYRGSQFRAWVHFDGAAPGPSNVVWLVEFGLIPCGTNAAVYSNSFLAAIPAVVSGTSVLDCVELTDQFGAFPFPIALAAPGDIVWMNVTREGTDINDTYGNLVRLWGIRVRLV